MSRTDDALALIAGYIDDRDVLEIACGTAEFSLSAAEIARSVTCVDIDDARLSPEAASTENLRFRRMDAAALRFAAESFDTAVLYNAVFHLEEILADAIDEALRVLRPGGAVWVISSWRLDAPVITDTLLPLLEEKHLSYRFSFTPPFTCVRIRK